MYKFFVKEEEIENNKINITGEDFNHIKNVLRLEIGENIYQVLIFFIKGLLHILIV